MSPQNPLDDLTTREREVLDLVRLGLTNEEIAGRLGITEAGAKYHVSQILSRLGVSTREEAAAVATHAPAPHVAEAFQPRRSRWWAALPLAAKAAGVAVVLAAVAGLGVLAWGVLAARDDESKAVAEPGAERLETFRVEGAGMAPILTDGMVVSVQPYMLTRPPARGDIVVFLSPEPASRLRVKRLIGLPGDSLEIEGSKGTLRIDGELLDEPYVSTATMCMNGNADVCAWKIPEPGTAESEEACGSDRCYFVMGDNRQNMYSFSRCRTLSLLSTRIVGGRPGV